MFGMLKICDWCMIYQYQLTAVISLFHEYFISAKNSHEVSEFTVFGPM